MLLDQLVALGGFEIRMHHFRHQLLKTNAGTPTQLAPRLAGIAEQGFDLGGTEVARINGDHALAGAIMGFFLDTLPAPGQRDAQFSRCRADEIAHTVLHAGGDDEVLGLVLLQHQPLHLDVIAGVAPIAFGVEVTEVEAILQAELDPMSEDALLTGPLEPTNEPYAIAKIAGIKLCESYNRQYGTDFRSVMPTNLYGPGDNYHPENSHVIPALIRRFHEAKEVGAEKVVVWGSGTPRREFLYVDDMAEACVHIMSLNNAVYQMHTRPMLSHVNVGTGIDVTIRELAELVARVVGFAGKIEFDASKPDGTPRKLMDVSCIAATGWSALISLEDGLEASYAEFCSR